MISKSRERLGETVRKVEEVSMAMGMNLGLRKRAVAHVRAGRVREGGPLELSTSQIDEIREGDMYRYLGVAQLLRANLKKTKQRIRKEYLSRVWKTWKSNLNSRGETTPGERQYTHTSSGPSSGRGGTYSS